PVGTSVVYDNNEQTNVGIYAVEARISGGTNYKDLALPATLTITKAELTGITFTGNSFVYDGSPKSLAISGTLPNGASVLYDNNARTDSGSQTVTANIDGGTN